MLQFVFMVRGGDLSTANGFDASQTVSGSLMHLGFSYSRSGLAPTCLASGDLEGASRHSQEDRDFQELDHLFSGLKTLESSLTLPQWEVLCFSYYEGGRLRAGKFYEVNYVQVLHAAL